jgi:hypothetical protein
VTSAAGLNDDFLDMLRALAEVAAAFLVVGAHALSVHGVPRATGYLDLFIRPSRENAGRVFAALRRFGARVEAHGLTEEDLAAVGTVYQIGLPPRRIDLLTSIDGVGFDEAWDTRLDQEIAGLKVSFIGRDAFVRNKLATGRATDRLDVELLRLASLEGAPERGPGGS